MRRRVDIALICVTHRSEGLLNDFAEATSVGLAAYDARLVLVDSGSPDETVAKAAALMPIAEICELEGNRGFSAGINAGVDLVRASGGADVFVVINPDVRLRRDTIGLLVDRLRTPGVGMAVPQLRDQFDQLCPSLRHAPSTRATWCEAVLGGPLAGRLHLPTEVVWDHRAYLGDTYTSWATGAVMAITANCLNSVGPWDESYFLYEEEVDFCLRAGDSGFRVAYAPLAVATRLLLTGPVSPWAHALMRANRATLVRRRRSRANAALTRAGLLVGDALRSVIGRPEARAGFWSVWNAATPSMVIRRYYPEARL